MTGMLQRQRFEPEHTAPALALAQHQVCERAHIAWIHAQKSQANPAAFGTLEE